MHSIEHFLFPSISYAWCVAPIEMLHYATSIHIYVRHKPTTASCCTNTSILFRRTTYTCICTLCHIVLSLYPTFSYVVCYSQRMGQILYVVQAHCIYLQCTCMYMYLNQTKRHATCHRTQVKSKERMKKTDFFPRPNPD